VDIFGVHGWNCCPGLRTKFHDSTRDIFRNMAHEAGLRATIDDLGDYLGPGGGVAPRRPDIVLHNLHQEPTLLDITFANPFCTTHLPRAAEGRLALARFAAQEKRDKYAQPGYNDMGYDFIPLAGEFGGGVCDEWTSLIATLAAHYLDTDAFQRSGRARHEGKAHFVQWWGKMLSCNTAKAHFTFLSAQTQSASRADREFQQLFGDCTSSNNLM